MDTTSPEYQAFLDSLLHPQAQQHFLSPQDFRPLTAEEQAHLNQAFGTGESSRALGNPGHAHSTGLGGALGAIASTLDAVTRKQNIAKQRASYNDALAAQQAQASALRGGGPAMSAPVPLEDTGAQAPMGQAPQGQDMQQQMAQAAALRKPSPVGDYFPVMDDLGLGGGG